MEERTTEWEGAFPGNETIREDTAQGVLSADEAEELGEDREETAQTLPQPVEEVFAKEKELPGADTVGEEPQHPAQTRPEQTKDQLGQQTLAQLARQLLLREAQRQLEQQMEQIHRLDPALARLEDLARQPEFPEFDKLVKGGQDLVSAYKLAFFDRYARRSAQAAQQAAINAARSKEHLAAVGQGSQPQDDGLTDELVERYRQFNPGMSRTQIARYHARYRKEKQDV